MNKNTLATGLIVAFLIIGTVFLIAQRRTSHAPSITSQQNDNTTQNQPTSDPNIPVKEFSMTAKQFSFDPETIKVKQGDKVRLTIKSTDVPHSFALPDFNVNVDLQPDKTETIEFIANKAGEFTFFCSIFCGSGHPDMKGKLIVE